MFKPKRGLIKKNRESANEHLTHTEAVQELTGAFSRFYNPIEGDIFVVEQYVVAHIGDGLHIDMRVEPCELEIMGNLKTIREYMDRLCYWFWVDQKDEFDMSYPRKERKAHPEVDWTG